MAPKGTSVRNSQAKGPELDETLESHCDYDDTEEAISHWGRIFQVAGRRRI